MRISRIRFLRSDLRCAIVAHPQLHEGVHALLSAAVPLTRLRSPLSPSCFLSTGVQTWRLPSLHRVPAGPVPLLRRYYEGATSPAVHPGALRFVASRAGTALSRRRRVLPRSRGSLVRLCPALRPRRACDVRPLRRRNTVPVLSDDVSPFEAQSHGLSARCLRFAALLTDDATQDSLPAAGQLYRTGFAPAGMPSRGF